MSPLAALATLARIPRLPSEGANDGEERPRDPSRRAAKPHGRLRIWRGSREDPPLLARQGSNAHTAHHVAQQTYMPQNSYQTSQ